MVIGMHPAVDRGLGGALVGEGAHAVEQFGPQSFVPALNFPSCGWRARFGQPRCDAVFSADIPGFVLSSRCGAVVCPGTVFVVDGSGFEAAVEDADEAVG